MVLYLLFVKLAPLRSTSKPLGAEPMSIESKDFFRDDELVSDPYPYLAALRGKCPVMREHHHDVVMVTGYDEALAVLGDATTYSSCMSVTGPFP
jgi:hypothetical protein